MSDTQQGPPQAETKPIKVKCHFAKSRFYRVIHADGAWGGLTPQVNIQMALYSERVKVPDLVTYAAESSGLKELERDGKSVPARSAEREIERELEADVILSLEAALALRDWLDKKIDDATKARQQLSENRPQKG